MSDIDPADINPGTSRNSVPPGRPSGVRPPENGAATKHPVKVLGESRPIHVWGGRDQRIALIGDRQRGRMSRGQLLAAGIPSNTIDRLRGKGTLVRAHRSVYALVLALRQPLGAETAALLACGDGAVLSHHTAGLLWKIIPASLDDGSIHVTVLGRHAARPCGVRVHRSDTLTAQDIRVSDGLPVVSPARALIDLAEFLATRDLERAVDEAIVLRLVSRHSLKQAVALAAGRRGVRRLAAAVARHDVPRVTRSEAERRFWTLMKAACLARPQVNTRVHGYEVDFYWPEQRLVVEIDGYRYHSSRPAFERDSAKGAVMTAAGLKFMRFTWLQMEHEPLAVVARVAQALARP